MRRSDAKVNVNSCYPARIAVRAACLVLAAILLVGCSVNPTPPGEPKIVTVVNPVELTRAEFSGQWITADKNQCISPDGKHLLVAVLGESAETLSAIPLLEEDGGSGQGLGDPIDFYSIDTTWTKHNLVQWIPVGWLWDEKCVFIVHGWQNGGEHHGERGTAVMVGDLAAKTSSLVCFTEAPEPGEIVNESVLTEAGELIFRVSEKIWAVDIQSGTKRLIREDFPNYGPLFYFALSPKGDYAVYSLNEDDRRGIFIMDLATGTERPLLPAGDTFSFYPVWSPDGKYIMAYTAGLLPDASGQGLQLYTLLPAEDGPLPAAEAITVVDVQGNVVKIINLDADRQDGEQGQSQEPKTAQFLFQYAWLADSEHMVFVSGPVTLGKWGEVQSMDYTGAWIGDVGSDSEPVNCADLLAVQEEIGEHISYIYPVSSLPDGEGALLNIVGAESASIWRVSTDGSWARVLDGWWETARLQPYFLDSVVGIVSQGGQSRIRLVGPSDVVALGEETEDGVSILGYSDRILITAAHSYQTGKSVVYVYSMLDDMVQE